MPSTASSTLRPIADAAAPGAWARAGAGTGVARKLLHVAASLGAAAVVWAAPGVTAAVILAVATTVALAIELARRSSPRLGAAFLAAVGPMLRDGEAGRLTGATTLAMALTATVLLFPASAALYALLVAGLADPAAALVGRGWGRRRYRGGKSVEGSAAFLVVALGVGVALPGVGLLAAAGLALAMTLLEAPRLRLDDNLYLAPLAALLLTLVAG